MKGIFRIGKDGHEIIIGEYYEIFNNLFFTVGIILNTETGYSVQKIIKFNKIVSFSKCYEINDAYVRTIILNKIYELHFLTEEVKEKFINIIWNKEYINKINIYFAIYKKDSCPFYFLGIKENNKVNGLIINNEGVHGIHKINNSIDCFDIIEPVIFKEDIETVMSFNRKYYWSYRIPKEIRDTIEEKLELLE